MSISCKAEVTMMLDKREHPAQNGYSPQLKIDGHRGYCKFESLNFIPFNSATLVTIHMVGSDDFMKAIKKDALFELHEIEQVGSGKIIKVS